MCGRFTYKFTWAELHALLNIHDGAPYQPLPPLTARYNVAPTQQAPVVRQDERGLRSAAMLAWGLKPAWMGATVAPINVRAESLAAGGGAPMFRYALKYRRCVVPASGFYGWQKVGEGKGGRPVKQPWHIHRADGGLILF